MQVYLYDLPVKCRGFILRDPYTDEESIIINARLTREANVKTYIHEIRHKLCGDLDSDENINIIEARAHSVE